MSSQINPRGLAVIAPSIVFMVIATIFVLLRLFVRLMILKNAGFDELAIGLSLLSSILLFVMTVEQAKHGLGEHFTQVSPADFEGMLKYLWLAISFYHASLCLTKASIVLQYLRLFVDRGIRRSCWAILACTGVWGIWAVTSNIFNCTPVSGFWSPTPTTHCLEKKVIWFFNASFNIVTDLIILILPMPTIKSLNLPRTQKVGLMIIFALGGFVCLASVIRLQSLYTISVSIDPTYDNTGAALWSNIEVYTGLTCASLPMIKPLLLRYIPNLSSSIRSGEHTYPFGTHTTMEGGHIRLTDVNKGFNTVTKVEASDSKGQKSREERSSRDLRKDIFVTNSIRQDVESKSETGSEKDLIVQQT